MSSRPKNPKYARNKNILVIGGSGSGKTYLARRLAQEYDIPHVELDELQWDSGATLLRGLR